VQYILWYGVLGTLIGRKLLWLARLMRPLGGIGSLLAGISGGRTVLANDQPFAHSEEFVMVGHTGNFCRHYFMCIPWPADVLASRFVQLWACSAL
jgi:hypothetical protein